jgi:hypothetical protein
VVHGKGEVLQEIRPDGPANDFGSSVAVDGDIAIIGAPGTDVGEHPGAAYVFHLDERKQVHRLTPKLPHVRRNAEVKAFGEEVAISGRHAFVADPRFEDESGVRRGAVFVFDLTTGSQSDLLTGPTQQGDGGKRGTGFAQAIAAGEGQLVVGAPAYGNEKPYRGEVFVVPFGRAEGRTMRLAPDQLQAQDDFGTAVAIGGGHIAATTITTRNADDDADDNDPVFLFEADTGKHIRTFHLGKNFDLSRPPYLGESVAVGKAHLLAGGPSDGESVQSDAGFLFDIAEDTEPLALKPNEDVTLQVGTDVAVNDSVAVVGTRGIPHRDFLVLMGKPRVEVFSIADGKHLATLFRPGFADPYANQMNTSTGFGDPVAVTSGRALGSLYDALVLVGAPRAPHRRGEQAEGAVFLFGVSK